MKVRKGEMPKMSRRILIILLAGSLSATLQAAEWQREVVDRTVSGKFCSLRVDRLGNAHVAYLDATEFQLKYSFWDSHLRKWFTQTLDRSGGYMSMVLDSKDYPHISYGDYGTPSLKYIFWNGTGWQKQNIRLAAKDISFYSSITLDPANNPRISYYEYWGLGEDYSLHLRNVAYNGKFWESATIDGTPGSGKMNSIVTDSKGNPHILYANVKSENASLRFADWNGKSWDIEIIEGANKTFGAANVALILDKDDIPHITYTDAINRLVKYATRRNRQWQIQVVDSLVEPTFPDRNGLALDDQGNPYISYADPGRGIVKVTYRQGQKWVSEIVDEGLGAFTPSLQINQGTLWMTYADETAHVLKCARRSLNPPAVVSQKR